MSIRSSIHMGLQRRGNSKVDSDLEVKQTGDMELTISSGKLTTWEGDTYEVSKDQVLSLSSIAEPLYVCLVLTNPPSPVVEASTLSQSDMNARKPFTTTNEPIQSLNYAGWFVIPPNATVLPDFHVFTWIDNDVVPRKKPDGSTVFIGKGEETGKEHEFDEMEHFAQRKGQGGVFFYCPECGAVTRGRPCKECGNLDCVRVKDCR